MRNINKILIIMAVLSLTGCTFFRGSHADEDVYMPSSTTDTGNHQVRTRTGNHQVRTRHPVDLPTDLNKADVQDYYEVPGVVQHKNEPKPEKELTPPKI